jgi:hypothetical protein
LLLLWLLLLLLLLLLLPVTSADGYWIEILNPAASSNFGHATA